MAIGVPETEVFAAADAVLARGERPTVERVRTELGRGSPARVGQLLEQWWEQLAQRLKGHALLPDLPGEVAQGFADLWRLAVQHAETTARAALAEDQNALFAEQTSLTQERKLWEIALAEAQRSFADQGTKLAQADAQLLERQALVDQLSAQRADLLQQRDYLQAQVDQLRADLDGWRAERDAFQERERSVEDRAHQQIDAVRQEMKTLQHRMEREQRDHAKQVAQWTTTQEALLATLHAAEQAAAHQSGRVAALEAALHQWRKTTPATKQVKRKVAAAKQPPPRSRTKKTS